MNEKDAIRKDLKILLDFNNSDPENKPYMTDQSGVYQLMTVHQLQGFNEEHLTAIADLLGMSDLYLDE